MAKNSGRRVKETPAPPTAMSAIGINRRNEKIGFTTDDGSRRKTAGFVSSCRCTWPPCGWHRLRKPWARGRSRGGRRCTKVGCPTYRTNTTRTSCRLRGLPFVGRCPLGLAFPSSKCLLQLQQFQVDVHCKLIQNHVVAEVVEKRIRTIANVEPRAIDDEGRLKRATPIPPSSPPKTRTPSLQLHE